jgi:hypothetical protein
MPPEPDEAADPATVCVIPVTRITFSCAKKEANTSHAAASLLGDA